MRVTAACLLVLCSTSIGFGQTVTIQGTVRNLDGTPSPPLTGFAVTASQGNLVVGRGALVGSGGNQYSIPIDSTRVGAADVRVLLFFEAIGRDPTTLNQIVGRTAVTGPTGGITLTNITQTIDVVMPLATTNSATPVANVPCYQPYCLPAVVYNNGCQPRRRWGLFHSRK